MAYSKKRIISFFLAFLMALNVLMPTASFASGIETGVSNPQTRGADYTVSLDLRNIKDEAAQIDLSERSYHLYLCLKVMDADNQPQYKYYINSEKVTTLSGVYTSQPLNPSSSFTDIDGTQSTEAFDPGSAEIVQLGLVEFKGDPIPRNINEETAIGFDANSEKELSNSITINGKRICVDGVSTGDIATTHTLQLGIYDKAIGPYDVLDDAAEFGVVANTYIQREHAETNFAVNTYTRASENAKQDVDGAGGGAVPFYVATITSTLAFANRNVSDADIYCPPGTTQGGQYSGTVRQESYNYNVTLIPTDDTTIRQKVNGMISYFRGRALAYSNQPMIQPTNSTMVDTTMYEDGITIYIDGTNFNFAQTGWKIRKLEGQTLVFNIPKSNFTLAKEMVAVYKKNADGTLTSLYYNPNPRSAGEEEYIDSNTEGHGGNATHNKYVEDNILDHIFFNAYNASSISLKEGPAGTFLFTNGNANGPTITEDTGSGTGWIATNGTFDQKNSEWHFFRTKRNYQPYGQTAVKVKKELKDSENHDVKDDTTVFTFRLYNSNSDWGIGTEVCEPRTGKAGDEIGFPKFEYTKEQLRDAAQNNGNNPVEKYFYYIIAEDIPQNEGKIKYDTTKFYIKVKARVEHWNKDKDVNTTVYISTDKVNFTEKPTNETYTQIGTFTNRLKLGSLKIRKAVTENGSSKLSDKAKQILAGTYEFLIYTDENCTEAYPDNENPITVSVTIGSNGETATSEEVIDMPEGDYWIVEKDHANTLPNSKKVQVYVTAGETGEDAAIADFTNNYVYATTTFGGQKAIENRDFMKGDTWTFTVKAVDGGNLPNPSTVDITPKSGKTQDFEFGTIEYKLSDITDKDGNIAAVTTYTYTVEESGSVAGVKNDTNKPQVQVVVKYDETTGKMTAEVVKDSDAVKFTNTYDTFATTTFGGQKAIENRDFKDGDSWIFTVTSDKGNLPKNDKVTIEPTSGKTETFDFGEIKYELKDITDTSGKIAAITTYTYTVTESGSVPSVTNDKDATRDVKVVVTYNETTGEMKAVVDDSSEVVTFTNTYNTKGSATLSAQKAGENLGSRTFSFILKDESGKTIDRIDNIMQGDTATFKTFEYVGVESQGTYTYTINEVEGTLPGVTYDKHIETVTITVKDNTDGMLVVKYNGNDSFTTPVWTNTYAANGSITFTAKKTIVRKELAAGDFSFELRNAKGTVLQTKSNDAAGNVTFDTISYDLNDLVNGIGAYDYTINEVKPTDPTIIYDTKVYPIHVDLEDNGDGTIEATPDKDFAQISFINSVARIEKLGNTPDGKTISLGEAYLEVWAPNGTKPVDAWTTVAGEAHEVEGLDAGVEYTLKETVVPKYDNKTYYKFADDTTFTVNEDGMITYSKGLELRSEDGTLLLNDKLAEKPESEKKIKDTNDTTGETSDWQDSADYDIGDDVPYKLTAKLADNVTDYKTYHITFHDKMEKGLTFIGIDKVTLNGADVDADDYALITETTDGDTFDLTLTWKGENGEKIADMSLNSAKVEVYFTAKLNSDANLGSLGNINTSYLEFSCNANNEDGSDTDRTEDDTVICFTYEVVVNKVDKDGKALTGAEFKLEKKLVDGTKKEIDRLTMKDNTFTFTGLDDGDYVLTEIYVPVGMKAIAPIEFTVTAEHDIVWKDQNRTEVLTSLTGDVATGALKLEANEDLSKLIGDVKNEEAEKPEFEKKIKDTNDSTGETSDWQDSADYDIGDAVPYKLTATLADNVTDYRNYHITFKDEMETSLTFNGIDKVTVKGEEVDPADYELTSDEHSFNLTLTWKGADGEKIKLDLNKAVVEVYFTAILNKDAVLGNYGNVNTAKLAYSCNSNVDENGKLDEDHKDEKTEEETEEDSVIAFTYEVAINKVDKNGKALTGAEFQLEKKLANGSFEPVDRLTVKDNTFTFTGLDDGIYKLTETYVPVGMKAIKPVIFEVEAKHTTVWEGEERTTILTSLTGDEETGALKLEADEDLSTLTGDIKNEETKKPEFEKKIKDTNDTTGKSSDWQDSADYDIGDAVPYRLTATLADNVTDYRNYHITFHDVMEESLDFNGIQMVMMNGTKVTDYKLNSDTHTFDLTLTWKGENGERIADKNLNSAKIEVYFTAILNKDAVLGNQGNVNTGKLIYSCNSNVDKDGKLDEDHKDEKTEEETEEDSVIAFTYEVDINKVDKDGKALTGAKFTLEKKLADDTKKLIDCVEVNDGTTFTFTGLDDGDYVLTETYVPVGMKAIAPIEFTVTAEHNIVWNVSSDAEVKDTREDVLTGLTGDVTTGTLKLEADEDLSILTGDVKNEEAEKPEFEKKIKDTNDSTGETSDWQDSADYDIGDAVPYKLTATLADNVTDYRNYHITFKDEMETGLTFNGIDKVTVKGEEVKSEDYELTSDGHGFNLTLTWKGADGEKIKLDLNKAVVEVYFTAILNKDAVLGNQGNVNTGKLIYSCNSNVDENGKLDEDHKDEKTEEETEEDSVIAFTYKTVVNKVDEDGNALTGAEFELYKQIKDSDPVLVDCVTAESGDVFTFTGLDDGIYVLKETKHPDGYKPIDDITFEVKAEHKDTWETEERTKILTALTGDNVKEGEVPAQEITFEPDLAKGSITGDVINETEIISAIVKKVWDDDNNRDGLRKPVTVHLMADGEDTGRKVTLSEPSWIGQINGLEKMKNGKQIKYTWSEDVPEGYTMTGNVTNGTLTTITNTHGPEEVEIKVRKVWEDNNDQAKKRPTSITVQLYADGEAVETAKLDASNEWSYSWTELKMCKDANGSREIVYTVAELDIPEDYICTIIRDGEKSFVIKNTYDTGKLVIEKEFAIEPWEPFGPDDSPMDIPVIKTWNDNDNKDGNRPEFITVRLYADGLEVANAQLTEANKWRYTFTGMPRLTEEKDKIVYTITEDAVEWYETEINGFNIRNNYKPELTSVTVNKIWVDNNDAANKRPASIAMTLSNGTVVILSAENNWSATIKDLPTRVNGQPVTYTWTEQQVLNYNMTEKSTAGSVTTFTNSYVYTKNTTTTKTNTPRHGNPTEELEDYKTPLGVNVMINHVGDCFD